jgi:hypothetical protein
MKSAVASSKAERRKQGKALREKCSRTSQAEWKSRSNRMLKNYSRFYGQAAKKKPCVAMTSSRWVIQLRKSGTACPDEPSSPPVADDGR